jgi:hypothetical protein
MMASRVHINVLKDLEIIGRPRIVNEKHGHIVNVGPDGSDVAGLRNSSGIDGNGGTHRTG